MLGKILILFIFVPLIEISILLIISEEIGIFPTIAVIVLTGIIGGYLTRREGIKTLRSTVYKESREDSIPKEIADGILILIGGAFLLTPGIITDIIGFLFILPLTRPIARKILKAYLGKKVERKIIYWTSEK